MEQIKKIFHFKKHDKCDHNRFMQSLITHISNITATDEEIQVVVDRLKKKPTGGQRGYYFATVLPTINTFLTNRDGTFYKDINQLDYDIRSAIADEYGLFEVVENKLTGKEEKRYYSLSDAKGDRNNVRKYIEAVLRWAAGEGVYIPNPYRK